MCEVIRVFFLKGLFASMKEVIELFVSRGAPACVEWGVNYLGAYIIHLLIPMEIFSRDFTENGLKVVWSNIKRFPK